MPSIEARRDDVWFGVSPDTGWTMPRPLLAASDVTNRLSVGKAEHGPDVRVITGELYQAKEAWLILKEV
jgi:hypothetical protein